MKRTRRFLLSGFGGTIISLNSLSTVSHRTFKSLGHEVSLLATPGWVGGYHEGMMTATFIFWEWQLIARPSKGV